MHVYEKDTFVVIAGANYAGLLMGLQLISCGIQPVIINKSRKTKAEKLLILNSLSINILCRLGLQQMVVEKALEIAGIKIIKEEKTISTLDFNTINKDQPKSKLIVINEDDLEKILLQELTSKACPVYWNISLESIVDEANSLILNLKQANEIISWQAEYLVISEDNYHLPNNFEATYFTLDIDSGSISNDNFIKFILSKKHFFVEIPKPQSAIYTLIALIPKSLREVSLSSLKTFEEYFKNHINILSETDTIKRVTIFDKSQNLCYPISERLFFLENESGENLGVVNANHQISASLNLAWKLAAVLKGSVHKKILNTFKEEVETEGNTLENVINWFLSTKSIMVKLFKFAFGNTLFDTMILKKLNNHLSKTLNDISLEKKFLSVHHSNSTKVKAGTLLPDINLYDEKQKELTTLRNWCCKYAFTVLIMGTVSQTEILGMARWIKLNYTSDLRFFYLPYTKTNHTLFNHFDLKANQIRMLLIRPDNFVGLIGDKADMFQLDIYLKNIVGFV